jgi:choline dehydrogenase-like flavoprotein
MATKRTSTPTKRTQSVKPVGTTIATRGPSPMEGEPNDVKVKRPRAVRNTRQMNATVTGQSGMDAQAYDDMLYGSPSDRPRPPEAEYVASGQADRKADGKAIIPEWMPASANIADPHAVNRTTMQADNFRGTVSGEVQLDVPAYHKAPSVKTYTPEDNQAISMMSTGQVSIHSPISSGINRAG